MTDGPLDLVRELAAVFDTLGIEWVLGGSLASSLVGEPRSTLDIDFAVRLDQSQLEQLLDLTSATYYVPADAARRVVDAAESFDLIHHKQAWKVDLFVIGDDLLDRRQMERRRWVEVPTAPPTGLWVTSTEDQILRKLAWHAASNSDRQWRDVVGILVVQQDRVDLDDLRQTAEALGLADELNVALKAARETD